MTGFSIVDLTDETDDLVGYGVCVVTSDPETKRETFELLPAVHGVRSEAHTAALDARDDKTTMIWQLLYTLPSAKDAHRLFTTSAQPGRVFIADNSGKNPSLTDDGPIYIDKRSPIKAGNGGSALVPTMDLDGRQSHFGVPIEDALFIANEFGMVLDTGDARYRIVRLDA